MLVVRLNGVDCLDFRLLFEFAFFLLYQYVNALYCQLLKLQLQLTVQSVLILQPFASRMQYAIMFRQCGI